MVAQYSSVAPATAPCRTCFLSVDQLGSTRLVTDIGASVVGRHDYVPFGQEIPGGWAGRNSDWGANDSVNQKFTGQERDADTNIDYFKARYYGSLQGRFTTPDSYAGSMDISNPQSFNRYAYVLGNPLGNTDPSGMFIEQNPIPPDNGDDGGTMGTTTRTASSAGTLNIREAAGLAAEISSRDRQLSWYRMWVNVYLIGWAARATPPALPPAPRPERQWAQQWEW